MTHFTSFIFGVVVTFTVMSLVIENEVVFTREHPRPLDNELMVIVDGQEHIRNTGTPIYHISNDTMRVLDDEGDSCCLTHICPQEHEWE